MNKPTIYIGIDTGVNTGVGVWDTKQRKLTSVSTLQIDEAMEYVMSLADDYHNDVFVRYEDARLRKFITGGREKLQGAGSIKRDAKIWEDFLTRKNIPHEAVAPKNNRTKVSSDYFKKLTQWQGRTSEHARDACMLVVGR